VVGVAIGVGLAVELLRRTALPTIRRQVNEEWLYRYRGWVYGAGFGLQLGLGVVTIVTTSAVYATLLVAFLAGSWQAGAVVGATFGLARAATVLASFPVTTPRRLVALDQLLRTWERRSRLGAAAAQAALAGASIALAVTP